MSGMIICGGGHNAAFRTVAYCPQCKCRRRMVVTLNGYWGSDMYCCGCGTHFSEDGFRAPPKTKATREIERAKELWKSVTMTRKEAYRADFGKVTTTEWNEEKQHITAYGHEEAGAEPTRTFLHRLRQYELAKEVVPLVENHLAPVYSSPTPKSIRRLSVKVKRLDLLANLSRADQAGRPPKDFSEGFAKIDEFEEAVSNMQIPQGGPKPLVCGDYLIELGLTPGPAFKTILDDVYEMQLEGEITTEWEAHERVHFFVNEWALN